VLELGIAFLLILLNGLFALSELAIVSARKARLKTMVDSGRAALALKLAEEPGRFLSTVQIGITLVGVLAGAFSGAFGHRFCFNSSRLLMARIVPHELACQLLSFADQPLGLLAQLVLFRAGAVLLTALAHCLPLRIWKSH
jgi:CBS domain containing-hemolysin-like protein